MNRRSVIFYIIVVIGIIVSAFAFENHKQMSPVFTVPFFSGAANYSYERGWHFYPQDFWDYKFLPVEAKESFRFTTVPDSSLHAYKHYNSGYIYIILLAKKLFFWLGDIKAVKFFQILSHILISITVCSRLKNRLSQVGFVCLYALNPFVIYFVTFPFLYFWQVLPSAVFTVILLSDFKITQYQAGVFGLLTAIAFCTRPTVVLLVALIGILLFLKVNVRVGLTFLAVFLGITLILFEKAENKSLWHTTYIGIGAYPNPYMQELTDNNGYALYHRNTGELISVSIGGNFYTKEVFERYNRMLLEEYLLILRHNPLLLVKNACVNFLQSFSIGYISEAPMWTNYLSALVGAIFLLWLVIKKQLLWIMGIALNSLAFTPYFPPIQAYMFGGYIILICAFMVGIQSSFKKSHFLAAFYKVDSISN